jgi:xanthosine utilization system XapX-like protein
MATPRSTRHGRVFRLAFLAGIVTSLLGSLLAMPTAPAAPTVAPFGTR